jgi:ACR3 family arsenite transporter
LNVAALHQTLISRIILICAEQAERILDNIGNVFRVFVPMITYFIIMWTGTFTFIFYLARRSRDSTREERYQMAVVQVSVSALLFMIYADIQSFTAGSNKFVLSFPDRRVESC